MNKGYYTTADAGYFDKDNYLHITAWLDDIIQVAGHRLSTSQMEEIILSQKEVVEALVVGVLDEIKGEVPFAVLVLKKNSKITQADLLKQLYNLIRIKISPICCLHNFIIVEKLPKTRSGKILRHIARKILNKMEYKVPPTIEDMEAVH